MAPPDRPYRTDDRLIRIATQFSVPIMVAFTSKGHQHKLWCYNVAPTLAFMEIEPALLGKTTNDTAWVSLDVAYRQ